MRSFERVRLGIIVGMLFFLGMALGAGFGTFNREALGYSLFGIVDWAGVSVLYFFYGGAIGFVIDYLFIARRKIEVPAWFRYTFFFSLVGILLSFVFIIPSDRELFLFDLVFPFKYGIFFPGFTYALILPAVIEHSLGAKLVFDLLILGIFGVWLILQFKRERSKIELWSLRSLFVLLAIGMISCLITLRTW